MKKHKKYLMIAIVSGGIGFIGLLWLSIALSIPSPEETAQNTVLLKSVTNVKRQANQLASLLVATNSIQSLDVNNLRSSLNSVRATCNQVLQSMASQGILGHFEWSEPLQQAIQSAQFNIGKIEDELRRLNDRIDSLNRANNDTNYRITTTEESIYQELGGITKILEKKPEPNFTPLLAVATSLVGLATSISGIVLAWRTDRRELEKLRLERDRVNEPKTQIIVPPGVRR